MIRKMCPGDHYLGGLMSRQYFKIPDRVNNNEPFIGCSVQYGNPIERQRNAVAGYLYFLTALEVTDTMVNDALLIRNARLHQCPCARHDRPVS